MTQATEGQPRWEVQTVQRMLEHGGKMWAWALIPGWGVCEAPGGLRVFTPDGARHLLVDGGSVDEFRGLCVRWSTDARRWLDEQMHAAENNGGLTCWDVGCPCVDGTPDPRSPASNGNHECNDADCVCTPAEEE